MESEKLLEYKRKETSTSAEPKTETASSQSAEKIPALDSHGFTFRLELPGNRFSPLGEW